MKVIRMYEFGGPEVLKVEEADKPVPGVNEVVIKVQAIGLNYAEVQQRKGTYPFSPNLPFVLGQWAAVAGNVEEVGEGVTGVEVGTRVLTQVPQGAYAEYVVVPVIFLIPEPYGISVAESTALLTQGQTAYHTLKSAGKVQAGETVLIHAAAGGVGSLAIQIAKALNVGKIIATAGTTEKLELALYLGADVAINYTDVNWMQQVMDYTDGKGADVILAMVGGEILQDSLQLLAPFGRLVYYGSSSALNSKWDSIDLVQLLGNKSIIGFNIAELLISRPDAAKSGLEHLFEIISIGQLKPVVKHIFPLEQAAEAHRLLESRQSVGTVVLQTNF